MKIEKKVSNLYLGNQVYVHLISWQAFLRVVNPFENFPRITKTFLLHQAHGDEDPAVKHQRRITNANNDPHLTQRVVSGPLRLFKQKLKS